jgi:adhesin transport system membrane fusion protein
MNTLDALLDRHPLPTWRIVAWPIMALIAVLLVWAHIAELDQVSVAPGEVIPQGKVKVVQHLEGGIIQEIFVTEGSVVKVGDPLLRLDLATSGVNRSELQARLDGELLRRARLAAEVEGRDLALPSGPAERQPNLAAAERQAFVARQRTLESNLQVLREQVRQRQLEIEELDARRRATARNLGLARERLTLSKSLLAEGLTAKMEHLQLQSEVESLEGELQSLTSAVPRARAAVAEADQRLKDGTLRFRQEAQEQLGQTEQQIARLQEVQVEATAQGVRAEIKSPIDGVVKNMRTHTIGGVIAPGEPIMEIVPTSDNLVVEARLNPIDRGYVHEGQKAVVKVTTYDFARYGGLEGRVIHVAPDSSMDKNQVPYFRVIVETDRTYLGDQQGTLPITPGMQASVDIHTDRRAVIDYLIKPVLKLRDEAFRER